MSYLWESAAYSSVGYGFLTSTWHNMGEPTVASSISKVTSIYGNRMFCRFRPSLRQHYPGWIETHPSNFSASCRPANSSKVLRVTILYGQFRCGPRRRQPTRTVIRPFSPIMTASFPSTRPTLSHRTELFGISLISYPVPPFRIFPTID